MILMATCSLFLMSLFELRYPAQEDLGVGPVAQEIFEVVGVIAHLFLYALAAAQQHLFK